MSAKDKWLINYKLKEPLIPAYVRVVLQVSLKMAGQT
jgi:hypothetical protein